MNDGTTQEALRLQYYSSRTASTEAFAVTLVTGGGAWYGTVGVDGDEKSRHPISRSGDGPDLLVFMRQLVEDDAGLAAESSKFVDLAAYRQRREACERGGAE
jgi:hypothetical protein